MSYRFPALAAAALTAFLTVPSFASGVVYTQATNFDGAQASQNDTTGGSGNFATAYDNFTLGAATNVDGFQFVGAYFNPPTQGAITAFTVNFFADAAGQPGDLLAYGTWAGNAGETSLGTDNAGSPVFSYGLSFSNPFAAAANTQYWVSIVPDLGFPPQWGWESSGAGDGIAYQDFLGVRTQLAGDMAFTLTGVPAVPEPGTYALFGIGLLGLAAVARRKPAS